MHMPDRARGYQSALCLRLVHKISMHQATHQLINGLYTMRDVIRFRSLTSFTILTSFINFMNLRSFTKTLQIGQGGV